MAIKPLSDRIVAKKDAPLEKTSSGIYLGEAKEKPNWAEVIAVGPDVKGLKKGDKIIFREYSATDIKIKDEDLLIIKEEDVLATV